MRHRPTDCRLQAAGEGVKQLDNKLVVWRCIDVGLESFATLSTGEIVDNPGHFAQAEKRLRRTQRRVSRRKKYSKRWRKAVLLVQSVHRDITNQRRDFQHKLSREIVD